MLSESGYTELLLASAARTPGPSRQTISDTQLFVSLY